MKNPDEPVVSDTPTPRTDACKWTPITELVNLSRQLERELAEACEQHTMELAAISTAATQNTESSRKQRIDRSNSYCTQAYLDVCRAVDREIELHEQLTAHKAALEKCEKLINGEGKELLVLSHSSVKESLSGIAKLRGGAS